MAAPLVLTPRAAMRPASCPGHVPRYAAQQAHRLQQQRGAALQTAAVAGLAEEQTTHRVQHNQHTVQEPQEAVFNWTKAWYPMMGVSDLDPAVPHAIMLLGKRLVLWRDARQQWSCLEDSCPHRRVPMSEGRIEPSDGNLQCCYHGWRFDGSGQCVAIPAVAQVDPAGHEHACNNPQACIPRHPVRVEQDMVWVWGDCSKQAGAESDATPVPWPACISRIPDDQVALKSFDNYVRDLHGAFDVWMENMADQSHVAYAHHGAAGNREGEKAGFFRMQPVRNISSNPEEGFTFTFDWASNSKRVLEGTSLQFKPPCLTAFCTGPKGVTLWIYAVPTSATTTRLVINSVIMKDKDALQSKGIGFILKRLPRWALHLTLNAVNDGDLVFMHRQSQWLRQAEHGQHKGQHYYLPGENDRGVTALRKWLNQQGGGGPTYGSETADGPADVFAHLDRHQLLDRYTQHTQNCTSCSQALKTVRNVRTAMAFAAGAALLAMAGIVGHEGLGFGPGLTTAAVTASAATAAFLVGARLERQFVFTDWVNPTND